MAAKKAASRRGNAAATNSHRETRTNDLERLQAELDMESSTWALVDLGPILAGERTSDPPAILARDDGAALLYRGKLHSLYGEPEAGKGWVALKASADVLEAGEHVLYVDFEDDAETCVERLGALGAEPDAIRERFGYVRPDEPLSEASRADLDAALDPRPSLLVIDGMTEALALEGIDLNNNTEVAKWIVNLPRRLARETGAATLIIDHQNKDSEARGRFAIGAQHKLAGIHVAYSIKPIKPFGRGVNGSSRIRVEKDRPGHVRKHAHEGVVAEMKFKSGGDGAVTIALAPPNPEGWRPADRMEAVSLALEDEPGLSGQALRRAVGGKEKTTDEAVRILVAEEFVRKEAKGPGKPTRHFIIKPYRQPAEES